IQPPVELAQDGPDRSELTLGMASPSASGFELLDLLREPSALQLDLVELPVQGAFVDAAAAEQGDHPVPLLVLPGQGGLQRRDARRDRRRGRLRRHDLAREFIEDGAGIADEPLDLPPDDLLDVAGDLLRPAATLAVRERL